MERYKRCVRTMEGSHSNEQRQGDIKGNEKHRRSEWRAEIRILFLLEWFLRAPPETQKADPSPDQLLNLSSRQSVPPQDSGMSRFRIPPGSGISRLSGFRSCAGFIKRNKERNTKRKIDNRKSEIKNTVVPPTGFGNYCRSGDDLFTIVCEYPLH